MKTTPKPSAEHVFPNPHHDEGCERCGGFPGELCEPPTKWRAKNKNQFSISYKKRLLAIIDVMLDIYSHSKVNSKYPITFQKLSDLKEKAEKTGKMSDDEKSILISAIFDLLKP